MGQTTSGLPWPEPTAPVRDGASAIRALAESLDKRLPYDQMVMGRGGYTTNGYGGIIVNVAGFTVVGLVAVTEQEGYSCTKPQGTPPVGQIWINVFSTSNGSLATNTFILFNFIAFGWKS